MQTLTYKNHNTGMASALISKNQGTPRKTSKLDNIRKAVQAWHKATPGSAQIHISQLVAQEWIANGGRGLLLAGSKHNTKQNFFRMVNEPGPKNDKHLTILIPTIAVVMARDNEKLAREFGLLESTKPELIASNIKECGDFHQVNMLGSSVDVIVKEGREAVESIMRLIPMESWGQVLGGFITMTPGIM